MFRLQVSSDIIRKVQVPVLTYRADCFTEVETVRVISMFNDGYGHYVILEIVELVALSLH